MTKPICQCGTPEQANDIACREIAKLIQNQCPLWGLQVAVAMTYYCLGELVANGIDMEKCKEVQIDVSKQMTKVVTPDRYLEYKEKYKL